jgi:acetoin utilization deacetylase AcuC-like enzyme
MKIVLNDKHALHDVSGRSNRGAGEIQLIYWDRHQVSRISEPTDVQEGPERILAIQNAINEVGLGKCIAPDDHGEKPIHRVHDHNYIQFLKSIYEENAKSIGKAGPVYPETFALRFARHKPDALLPSKGYYGFDIYTPISRGTWEAAYWSAQCAITGVELGLQGENVVYAVCRPSGHHAGKDYFGGFCYLNNAAIAAQHLHAKSIKKVAILDIDFHHGNGTQDIFYSDPDTLYCSLHGDPEYAFPYFTGYTDERGNGEGEGYNYNWPLPMRTSDSIYLSSLYKALDVITQFNPGYLVVSAGFDIGAGDPYGGFQITTDGLKNIGHGIASLATKIPIIIIQEGGYVSTRLGQYVVAFLSQFA